MKKIIAATFGVIASTVALNAQTLAGNNITNGDLALLAGWDFDGTAQSNSINARYSDVFMASGQNTSGLATVGRLSFDGTNGSDTWSISRLTGTNSATLTDSNQSIISRNVIGSSVAFTTQIGSAVGTEAALPFNASGATDTISFSFNSNSTLNSFNAVNLRFRAAIPNHVDASHNVTVNWSYKIGAAAAVSTGFSTVVNANNYSTYNVDFSSITAINGQDDVFLLATFVEGNDNSPVRFDNFAIYGTAAAIPEPSTFATLAGVAALGLVAARRRRQAA